MLYANKKGTTERVSAFVAALKNNNTDKFYCPACKSDMILKSGSINVPHFAHVKGTSCDPWYNASNEMSEWHRAWQAEFPESCREKIITNTWNGVTEKHIADVCINGYVLEFQHSPMSPEEFMRRTKFYYHCGYKIIWVFDFQDIFDKGYVWEYEDYKWIWKYQKKTFADFNPNFPYWKRRVGLFFNYFNDFDEQEWTERITWCIHEYDGFRYKNDYSRFCTSRYASYDSRKKFVSSIMKKQLYL